MNLDALKREILEQLPQWIEEDREFRLTLTRMLRGEFADKQQTESRIEQLLEELLRDREANERKWDEAQAESRQKWEEQNRKWDEARAESERKWEANRQAFDRVHQEIMAMSRRIDRTIGALGARWGVSSERSFRNTLAGILTESFGVEVINVSDFDTTGSMFGRPEQIEWRVKPHIPPARLPSLFELSLKTPTCNTTSRAHRTKVSIHRVHVPLDLVV